jgi:hypothetical protein
MATEIVGDVNSMSPDIQAVFAETTDLPADTLAWLTAERREWLNSRYVNTTWNMHGLEVNKEAIVEGYRLRMKLEVNFEV